MIKMTFWNQSIGEVGSLLGILSPEEEGIAQRLARNYLKANGSLEYNEAVLRKLALCLDKKYDEAFDFVVNHVFEIKDGMLCFEQLDSAIEAAKNSFEKKKEKSEKARQSALIGQANKKNKKNKKEEKLKNNDDEKNAQKEVIQRTLSERSANAQRTLSESGGNINKNKINKNNNKKNNKKDQSFASDEQEEIENRELQVKIKKFNFDETHLLFAKKFEQHLKETHPSSHKKYFCLDKTADTIRMLEKLDGKSMEFIECAFKYFIENDFWVHEIRSASSFRVQAVKNESKINALLNKKISQNNGIMGKAPIQNENYEDNTIVSRLT